MYLDHFNLKTAPFTLRTDPRFLWAGANQRQALATLAYGLQENRGVVVLSGEFGTGKTTLVNAFIQGLDDSVRVAKLPEPGADVAHFRMAVAEAFGLRIAAAEPEELIESLSRLADHRQDYDRRLLLVIDEAQGLTAEMQADLVRLACWEHQDRRLVHILLVGQSEIYQWASPATRGVLLHQVSASCRLHPLSESETAAYIDLRLRVAGALRPLFEDEAVAAIHAASRGVPRAINLMCDFALLRAHLQGADRVDAEMVALCKDRFQIALHDDGVTTEVAVRDLTTLSIEPPANHRGRLWRRLGFATPVLLLLVAVGVWYGNASHNPVATGDKADAIVAPAAPAAEPPPMHRTPPDPAVHKPPPIPAVWAQRAATLPFGEPRPDAKRDAPTKDRQRPKETVAGMQPAAQPAPEAKKTPKAADDVRPRAPVQEPPFAVAERKPADPPLGDPAGNTGFQGIVAPMTPASESPSDADPGDIIDWLIQKKSAGGRLQQPAPVGEQPASE